MVDSENEERAGIVAEGGLRLDRALVALFPDLSRARLQDLIRTGHVNRDGTTLRDPALKVAAGSRIILSLPPPEPAVPVAEAADLPIVYEDGDLIVIDKPAGLVVHPAPGHESGTLVNALIAHCGASLSGIGGVRRPGIVHRLDKDTSGLIVVAKNDATHQGLTAQFADHGRTGPLERAYAALVWGLPQPRAGTIRANLARSRFHREKIAVVSDESGRHAVTHYAVSEVYPEAALVRCELETGRTHQIRVHLAHLGHPLLGDPVYGGAFRTKAARLPPEAREALTSLGRQALHATLLGFSHPRTGKTLRFESPLPVDLATLVTHLRAGMAEGRGL
ncbi:23S rRNA pseudouridine1911/1915/1917 synthase [Methylobacterium phyllostachyos]|uniref:Pseudouridine synthase n=1 Tax=Methylobacterium phyllostachyos TaxID=582672 RepID=A0A1G9Z072_9HYPH|nr:RluA family pseudouridine synthase [Methylobacterium phyllostachyos]SDN14799.1 23S rRNA pseudouridine1911/1915/1917 synthase [Methylobacterium phyllostachyos]